MNSDAALLRSYVEENSEAAFTELVSRHVDLVYGAALRRTNGDSHQAADVAQEVFTSLSRHARGLTNHPAISGWLHTATRNAALNIMKSEQRRRIRETAAASDSTSSGEAAPDWTHVRPLLDAAIDTLSERDRAVIVLRFLEHRAYSIIGEALHVSEDAARTRTNRALEQLRMKLSRHGVTSTGAAIGLALANQTIIAAPAGLASTLASAAFATAAAAPVGASAAILFMSKLTLPIITGVLACVITTVAWNATMHAPTAGEVQTLRDDNARLTAATARGARPELAASIVSDLDRGADGLLRDLEHRQTQAVSNRTAVAPEKNGSSTPASSHRDHGQATPMDAHLTGAWAMDAGEISTLAKLIFFEGNGRQEALAELANAPASIRAQCSTPEELYAFFLSAQTQLGRPPAEDLLERMEPVEVGPGRIKFRPPGGTVPTTMVYQQTAEGWKLALPEPLIHLMAQTVLSPEFFAQFTAVNTTNR